MALQRTEQVLPLAQIFAGCFHSSVILFRAIAPIHERLIVEGEVFGPADQVALLQVSARQYLETIHRDFSSN